MTSSNEFQAYFGSTSTVSEPVFVEIPPPLPPVIEKTPTGFAPMERIELEGQAYRGLSDGHSPWWILVASWVIFGAPVLIGAVIAWAIGDFIVFVGVLPLFAMLWITWRGTQSKLAYEKEQARRKAKYRKLSSDETI